MFKGFVREGEVRRWVPWIGVGFLILIGVAIQISMESVCWDEDSVKAAKIGEAVGCFEFWFNRYQSLIGAMIALIAAYIATIPARGQLREMLRQSSASARQSVLEYAKDLEGEINLVEKCYRICAEINQLIDLYDNENPHDSYQVFNRKMFEVRTELEKRIRQISIISARNPVEGDTYAARSAFWQSSANLAGSLANFDRGFRSNTSGIDEEIGEVEMTGPEVKAARKETAKANMHWSAARTSFKICLLEDVENAWRQVRILEAKALTG